MYVLRYIERKSGELLLQVKTTGIPVKGEFVTIAGDMYRVHRRSWYPVDHSVDIILKEKS